jgi:hypothetical protein
MTACEHLVQFYDTDDELLNAVVPFIAEGLHADEAIVVIATEPHRLAFERALIELDRGLEQEFARDSYVAVDAAAIMGYLQGRAHEPISPSDFDATIGALVRRQTDAGRRLRVYGEIVALLWERGDASGAIAMETMWNDLRERHPFALFCGYPVVEEQLGAVKQVCRAHSFVFPAIADEYPGAIQNPLSADFTPTMDAPRQVRTLLRSALAELHVDQDLTERLTTAASELAANAVLHARTPFRLLVQPQPNSVWVAVEDRDPLRSPFEVVGRTPHGLGLIAALAVRWGVTPRPSGKIVWAEIPQ